MSLFSWLTGGSDVAGKAVDGVIDTLDALVFTDEEQSQANLKVLEFRIKFAEATQKQSISRRIIATIVTSAWLIILFAACGAGYYDVTDGSYSEFLFNVLKDNVNDPFQIILAFYFLAHIAGKFSKT